MISTRLVKDKLAAQKSAQRNNIRRKIIQRHANLRKIAPRKLNLRKPRVPVRRSPSADPSSDGSDGRDSDNGSDSSTESDDIPDLTFGIELEGILLWHESLRNIADHHNFAPEHVAKYGQHMVIMLELMERSRLLIQDFGTYLSIYEAEEDEDIVNLDTDNNCWKVTDDPSIVLFGSNEEVQKAVGAKNIECPELGLLDVGPPAEGAQSRWHQNRFEIKGPKMDYTREVYHKTLKILKQLNTSSSFLAFHNSCNLHVHVGRSDDQPMSLKALQRLMFATIMFEEEIDKIHEHHTAFSGYAWTNREFVITPEETNSRFKMTQFDGERQSLLPVQGVRDLIFGTESLTELQGLAWSCRNRRFNWTHISEDSAPLRTIEFRQHAMTLSPGEMYHWVNFIMALMKWANKDEEEADCLPFIKSWASPKMTMLKLFNEIELPLRTLNFYMSKYRDVRSRGPAREPYAKGLSTDSFASGGWI